MSASKGRALWLMLWLIAAIGAGVAIVFLFGLQPPAPPAPIIATPTTAPTTLATTAPATAPSVQSYGQLLHADYPIYPDTRPWAVPVELTDAAHIILREPVYVCSRGDLWLTRAGADRLQTVLARAASESEHIVDRRISYIIWIPNRRGAWEPSAICPTSTGLEIVSKTTAQPIPWKRPYHWDMAMTWSDDNGNRIIVPTNTGVSIITLGPTLTEDYVSLIDSNSATRPASAPAVLFDTRGLLAWIPADDKFSSTSVARYLDGKWKRLDPDTWPGDIAYLVPLLDGSVLQIRREDGDNALTFATLDTPDIDEKQISALVDQLGDDDPDKRMAAYQKLSQYGPKINPLLQSLSANAAPEAQTRIRQLMTGATLGGIAIHGNQLIVKSRLPDGGAIFFAPQGVTIAREGQEPAEVTPDYIAVRPGRPAQELPAAVVAELTKTNAAITAIGEELVLGESDGGPKRYLPPDQLDPLLRPSEMSFSRLYAIDSRGRWVFHDDSLGKSLVLDPTVPDPTPRLAIWSLTTGTSVGWNKNDCPVIARNDSRWMIDDHDWQPMDTTEIMTTDLPIPTEKNPPLLTDSAGNKYFDGQATLTVLTPTGKRIVWPLPDSIGGAADVPVHLVPDQSGHIFLFNSTGRIAQLRISLFDAKPFTLEALFTDHVPDFQDVQRVWLDPYGRIDVAYSRSHLAVIFPSGQIPREIGDKILPQDLTRIEAK